MRYEWKITLPGYKILYSIVFMVLTVMVRPVNSYSGIIAGLEPNVALLAGVFMADNYYKEYMGERISVFYRYPIRKKYISMLGSWYWLLYFIGDLYGGISRPIFHRFLNGKCILIL